MNNTVGHLHCRYRVRPAGATAGLGARLDRLALEDVQVALGRSLDLALASDPAVYVLRRVEETVVLAPATSSNDGAVARQWANVLAGSVVRRIARDAGDGADLVQFADQPDFVARFVGDLVAGSAWDRWYFGAFDVYRRVSVPEALRAVLLDHLDDIDRIVTLLRRYGTLGRVLGMLDEDTLAELWGARHHTTSIPELEPIVDAARQIAVALGATGGDLRSEAAALDTLGRRIPTPLDWQDPRLLTDAVLDALAVLIEPQRLRALIEVRGGRAGLRAAMPELGWIDSDWLIERLSKSPPPTIDTIIPTRSASRITPRQGRLLEDLTVAARAVADELDPAMGLTRNAIRLEAALVETAPAWAEDGPAKTVVEAVILAWLALMRSGRPRATLRLLHGGTVEDALGSVAAPDRAAADPAFRRVVGLGAGALDVLETVVTRAELDEGDPTLRSASLGAALLLRVISDVRLAEIVRGSFTVPPDAADGVPDPFAALLVAVLQRWGDADPLSIDPALWQLAGHAHAPEAIGIAESWNALSTPALNAIQRGLCRVLAGRRTIDPTILDVRRVTLPDGHDALVAGDGRSAIYPFGVDSPDPQGIGSLVEDWVAWWGTATGSPPLLTVHEPELRRALLASPVLAPLLAGRRTARRRAVEGPDQSLADLDDAFRQWSIGGLPPTAELTVDLIAIALLRLWARSLPSFAASSPGFLLRTFVRRSGQLVVGPSELTIELEPKPLDLVLEMAGFVSDIESLPWLAGRPCRIHIGGG